MSFPERIKLLAMAIVHIFETSKPFGKFDAYAVLDDGAGVSYGLSQFTHRSGSLLAVIEKYLDLGGSVSAAKFREILPDLNKKSAAAINRTAQDGKFKAALKAAAKTEEMQRAQTEIAQSNYFQKAVEACKGSNFVLPMSLAVIYDSINHGSWEKIRDRVQLDRKDFRSDEAFEKAWITQYVKNRDAWLESVPRLKKTAYRTDFFLAQIARGNWTLKLPLDVHGFNLTSKQIPDSTEPEPRGSNSADNPTNNSVDEAETSENFSSENASSSASNQIEEVAGKAENTLGKVETTISEKVEEAGKQIEKTTSEVTNTFEPEIFTQYIPNLDGAKGWLKKLSFAGIVSAVGGYFAGLPIWLVFLLGFISGAAFTGLIVLIVKGKSWVFAMATEAMKIRANPTLHNPELTPLKTESKPKSFLGLNL